jgi:hypothetical protein
LLALPIAAVIRETLVYLRRHLVFESWGVADPALPPGGPSLPAGRDPQSEEEREEVPSRS